MINVSKPVSTPPNVCATGLQRLIYETLERLDIEFMRVDNDPAVTMEDCKAINDALNVHTVKTLLLTNRQQTVFYLFVTKGDKPFVTRDFSRAMNIARVSFASEDKMIDLIETRHGAASPLCAVATDNSVISVVIDSDLLRLEWWGCPDSTTTCYMRLKSADILNRYLPQCGHTPIIIDV